MAKIGEIKDDYQLGITRKRLEQPGLSLETVGRVSKPDALFLTNCTTTFASVL